jgi:hypothetical protein
MSIEGIYDYIPIASNVVEVVEVVIEAAAPQTLMNAVPLSPEGPICRNRQKTC